MLNVVRVSGCQLGDRFFELEESWSPELEPAGVMYCVICQCKPVSNSLIAI